MNYKLIKYFITLCYHIFEKEGHCTKPSVRLGGCESLATQNETNKNCTKEIHLLKLPLIEEVYIK